MHQDKSALYETQTVREPSDIRTMLSRAAAKDEPDMSAEKRTEDVKNPVGDKEEQEVLVLSFISSC